MEKEVRGGGGGPARPRRLLIDSQLSAPPSHKLSRRCAWLRARTREPAALPAFLPPAPARPGPGPAPAPAPLPAPRPAQPLRSTEQVRSARRGETPNPPSSASSSSSPSFLPARSPGGWRGAAGSPQPCSPRSSVLPPDAVCAGGAQPRCLHSPPVVSPRSRPVGAALPPQRSPPSPPRGDKGALCPHVGSVRGGLRTGLRAGIARPGPSPPPRGSRLRCGVTRVSRYMCVTRM